MEVLAPGHSDVVVDVAFDLSGTRIATCSSDQKIKIWTASSEADGGAGSWLPQAEWKAHFGPVWRVTWAHPEFGQVLASCSFDHNGANSCAVHVTSPADDLHRNARVLLAVCIWEEQEGLDDKGLIVSRWLKRAQLGDARDSVNDIKFAPRHLGLHLAAASTDGIVRLYEATDTTSLAHWEPTVSAARPSLACRRIVPRSCRVSSCAQSRSTR